MGYKTFQIIVDSPTGSYYAGSNVTGRVIVALEKPKKVRGLKIEFSGKAKVSWSETESVRKDNNETTTETVTYTAEEEYFSNKYYIIGSESNEVEIPAGENVYPFSTTLPPRLPTSFDGEHGHVRYTIKATLDRPWKMDETTTLFVTVVTPVDLNLLPQVKEPMKKEANKTFCCLCCKSGPLTLAGTIPFSGYTPAQTIVATIEVDNASNVRISAVKCKLKKVLKWIAKSPNSKERIDNVDLVKVELDEVLPNGSKSWTQNIDIPHMPFLNLDACSIIKVDFFLEMEACATGPHKNLLLTFPITLGTVPLYQVNGVSQPTADPNKPLPLYPPLQPLPEPTAPTENADIGFKVTPATIASPTA
ncbi:unnamed protein product [Nezara viridula]|uniref:Arrestin C-terminal-like domain-containing protein n=1 Tax=Nezara viridula TaxID=85310 RepID=A0A9P0HST0_NEZVI|nr:unnamed protein product [Nezara viridula]